MSAKVALALGQCAFSSAVSWLVAGNPHVDQIGAGARHRPQGLGLIGVGRGDLEPVGPQPQVFGDHGGIPGVGLGARHHLAFPPGFEGVRGDRHDRVSGLQEQVDQPPAGALDPDRHIGRIGVFGQAAQQRRDALGGVLDGEPGDDLPCGVHHAHGVDLGGPVQADVELRGGSASDNTSPHGGSDSDPVARSARERSLTGALRCVCLLPVCGLGRGGGGGLMRAVSWRPQQTSARLPPSPDKHRSGACEKDGALVTSDDELSDETLSAGDEHRPQPEDEPADTGKQPDEPSGVTRRLDADPGGGTRRPESAEPAEQSKETAGSAGVTGRTLGIGAAIGLGAAAIVGLAGADQHGGGSAGLGHPIGGHPSSTHAGAASPSMSPGDQGLMPADMASTPDAGPAGVSTQPSFSPPDPGLPATAPVSATGTSSPTGSVPSNGTPSGPAPSGYVQPTTTTPGHLEQSTPQGPTTVGQPARWPNAAQTGSTPPSQGLAGTELYNSSGHPVGMVDAQGNFQPLAGGSTRAGQSGGETPSVLYDSTGHPAAITDSTGHVVPISVIGEPTTAKAGTQGTPVTSAAGTNWPPSYGAGSASGAPATSPTGTNSITNGARNTRPSASAAGQNSWTNGVPRPYGENGSPQPSSSGSPTQSDSSQGQPPWLSLTQSTTQDGTAQHSESETQVSPTTRPATPEEIQAKMLAMSPDQRQDYVLDMLQKNGTKFAVAELNNVPDLPPDFWNKTTYDFADSSGKAQTLDVVSAAATVYDIANQLTVDIGDLSTYASHIDGLSADLMSHLMKVQDKIAAANAFFASDGDLGDFANAFTAAAQQHTDNTAGMVDTLSREADNIRQSAAGYLAAEDTNLARFGVSARDFRPLADRARYQVVGGKVVDVDTVQDPLNRHPW